MSEIERKIYTQKEAEELVANLSKVFSVVRLLKAHEVAGQQPINNEKHTCYCFDIWGRSSRCQKCSSFNTLHDKIDRTKVEYLKDRPYQVFSIYLNVEGEDCVLEVLKDFTIMNSDPEDLKRLSETLLHVNEKLYQDPLTNTLNRAYFEEKKNSIFESAGVVFADIDDFKNLNDTYGHEFGDVVLKEVSKVLKGSVRSDDFVIRVGGDEFILILSNINHDILSLKLDYLLRRVSELILPEHPNVKISLTIGAAISNNRKLQDVVNIADQLMLEGKKYKNIAFTEWNHHAKESLDVKRSNKPYVLIVDDSDANREMLKAMLEDEYAILEATDGIEATKIVNDYRQRLVLILLDLEMPNMNGFSFLKHFQNSHLFDDVPVVIISADVAAGVIANSYSLGAVDYISRPFNMQIVKQRVHNIIKLYTKQRQFKKEISQQINNPDVSTEILAIVLRDLVNYHNHESSNHIVHIQEITGILLDELSLESKAYQFTEVERKNIITASNLHDVGKLGISDTILKDPNVLTAEEREIYKTHTLIGAKMIASLELYQNEPLMKYAYNICRWHHEKYDGTGYPDHLAGDAIPIEAQIVSLAIVLNSLVMGNPKAPGMAPQEAIHYIQTEKAKRFNPLLLSCLVARKDEIESIYAE